METVVSKLQHFQQYKLRYEIVCLCLYFFINNTLTATSVVMEGQRNGRELPFAVWEPFVWEYSSAISTLILFPLIVLMLEKFPFNWQAIRRTLAIYLVGSVVYSGLHVLLMVGMRKGFYALQSLEYDFGDMWFEFIYEYRKDLWSFIFFIGVIYAYRFITSRLQGEANPIQEGENEEPHAETSSLDRLLVKKLGKEFIIKVSDVEWMESSGNYVNLYINERAYPLRTTLGKLTAQLEEKGFCRIHRSHAVRLDAIESITPLSSGDSEVKLNSGKVLNISRRYKESFRKHLM